LQVSPTQNKERLRLRIILAFGQKRIAKHPKNRRALSSQRTAIGKTTLVIATATVVLVAGIAVLITVTTNSSITSSSSTTITTLSPNPGGSSTETTGNGCAANECPACHLNTTCGSFYYGGGNNQVQVNSIQATEFVCDNCGAFNGQSYVMFGVNFENTGSSPIYISAGTDGLNVSTYGDLSVLGAVTSERCAGTSTIVLLEEGQNYTMYAPGCDTGFDYQMMQAGTVGVTLIFQWTVSSQASTFPDATLISSHFIFA
jgi:hypothetical protein